MRRTTVALCALALGIAPGLAHAGQKGHHGGGHHGGHRAGRVVQASTDDGAHQGHAGTSATISTGDGAGPAGQGVAGGGPLSAGQDFTCPCEGAGKLPGPR